MKIGKRTKVAVMFATAICGGVVGREIRAAIIHEGSGASLRYGYGATAGGIDANTVHLWHMDEPSSPVVDFSGHVNAFDLAGSSGTAQQTSILNATGATGSAINSTRRIGTSTGGNRYLAAKTAASNSTDNITADQYNALFGADG
jgi:hypothetical protein